jgi:hypothetical protein
VIVFSHRAGHTVLPSLRAEAARPKGGTIMTGRDLEKIDEPAVSGGVGSQVITHNDDAAM